MVVGAMGFMFGTGGSALIARIMGEGRREKAQEIFSLLIAATVVSGLVIAVISILFLPQIAAFLGAKGEMLADGSRYRICGRRVLWSDSDCSYLEAPDTRGYNDSRACEGV